MGENEHSDSVIIKIKQGTKLSKEGTEREELRVT